MSRATPTILFGDNALAIKADATFSATDVQPFVDLTDLNSEVAQNKWVTYEPDMWLLDGSYHFLPAAPQVGFMSEGTFNTSTGWSGDDPRITIIFSVEQSTSGLTLYFSELTNDYINDLDIDFYDASDVLIRNDNYVPLGTTFSTNQAVSNFKKIILTFFSTNKQYRFARLMGIDFDTVTRFTDAEIKAAQLMEQINPLSVELPFNEITATLFSADGDFSIVDPRGVYATFHEHQPLEVYELLNGVMEYMGRFYLEEWKSQTANLADIRAMDAIGLMDTIEYLPEGDSASGVDPIEYYSGGSSHVVYSDDLIADIMLQAGFDYILDPSLAGIALTPAGLVGRTWLPIDSCRECLKLVLFRIGAWATASRSDVINIYPLTLAADLSTFDHTLTAAEMSLRSPIELKPLVTGVELTSHDYSYDSATSTPWIVLGALPAGTHIVKFNEPHAPPHTMTLQPIGSGTTVSNYGSAWLELTLPIDMTFVQVAANNWTDTKSRTNVLTGSPVLTQNIINIDATIVNQPNAATVAQRIYDYFQQRYLLKSKLFSLPVEIGQSVLADVQGKQVAGFIEKMTTNLIGFVSDAEIVGFARPSDISATFDVGTFDSTDSRILYSGTWSLGVNASFYGGSYRYATTIGNYVELSFIGKVFTLIYTQEVAGSNAKIYIDRILHTTLNQNGSTVYQKEWTSGLLSGVYHTVKIEKAEASGLINIDAIEIL